MAKYYGDIAKSATGAGTRDAAWWAESDDDDDGGRHARENRTLRVLQPPRPKQMVDALPAIHFLPVEHKVRDEESYECPLYKTATRAGVLSITGASSNFVVAVDIPTDRNPDYWVSMGAAMLCALAD